jgi:hypothetical protein
MRLVVAVIISLISAAIPSNVSAQQPACRLVSGAGASFLEECGDQLNSFTLSLSEIKLGLSAIKRQSESDLHGRFYFSCPVEPMCENEPTIGGFFISPAGWLASSKDEQAIYHVLQGIPLMAISWSSSGGPPPSMPSPACSVFDVSIGGMTGRGVCFDDVNAKSGAVFIVAGDDRVGFLLSFYQRDKPASALRDKVLELLPRFEIERATGDLGLKKWLR